MYTINFNPVILDFGKFQIRWYGLFYIFAFILLYLCIRYLINRKIVDFNLHELDDFIFYVMIGVIAGSRILYFAFYDIAGLFTLEVFRLWHGGMSFHGGLIGTIIAIMIFSRRYKKDIWPLLNITSLVAVLSLAFGRIGNFINSELAGIPFNGRWCVIFSSYDNICRHPYPIYAAISHLILFIYLAVLLYLNRNNIKEFLHKKTITINFLIGYGILRIITDIWKVDYGIFGIKTGQWLSILMIIIGLLLIKLKISKK